MALLQKPGVDRHFDEFSLADDSSLAVLPLSRGPRILPLTKTCLIAGACAH